MPRSLRLILLGGITTPSRLAPVAPDRASKAARVGVDGGFERAKPPKGRTEGGRAAGSIDSPGFIPSVDDCPVTTSAPSGSARPQSGPDADYTPDPHRWRAFSVCLVVGFMSLLDVSIVNVALPSIQKSLGASSSELQWVVSGYALTFGLVLVGAGRLGDVRGRRRMFLVGLVVFVVASAACGFATAPLWLIVARLVQGVGGGILNPQNSGFVQELFRGQERGKAFGLLGATIGLSTAAGPLAGGLLIQIFGVELGWRAVFFVNVPIGVVAFVLALRLLPKRSGRRPSASLDPVGVVLLGVGVLLVLLPLVQERSWTGATKWLLLPAGLIVLGAFVGWELRYARSGKEPMVLLDLFRVPSYSFGSGIGLVYFAGFTAIFFILALYLQNGAGYSALQAGLAVTPFALGSAVASALGGRVVHRFGRPLVAAGLAVVIVGLLVTDLVLAHVSGPNVGWVIALPLLISGLGSGVVISPNITLTLSEVPVQRAGSAGGVLQTGQRIGSAVGIAVVGSLFFNRLASSHGDWQQAIGSALRLCDVLVALALVVALTDLRWGRRRAVT
jgi:EmrB/QacA subfamily drug resistance transporter